MHRILSEQEGVVLTESTSPYSQVSVRLDDGRCQWIASAHHLNVGDKVYVLELDRDFYGVSWVLATTPRPSPAKAILHMDDVVTNNVQPSDKTVRAWTSITYWLNDSFSILNKIARGEEMTEDDMKHVKRLVDERILDVNKLDF